MKIYLFSLLLCAILISGLSFSVTGCRKRPQQPAQPEAPTVENETPEEPEPESPEPSPKAKEPTPEPEPAKPEPSTEKPTAKPDEVPAKTEKEPKTEKQLSNKVILGGLELTQGIAGEGKYVTVAEVQKWLDNKQNHEVLEVELPMGLKGTKIPTGILEANPITRAKVELGRQLFFDTRLSADDTVSCATCHIPKSGYAAHSQFGVGIDGQVGGRNQPVSYNRILSTLQFWDGRAASVEAQAVGPIENPIEMGNTHEEVVKTIAKIPGYKIQFEKIFGKEGVTIDNVGKAIATFERVIVTGPSAYDYQEKLKPFAQLEPEDFEDDPKLKKDYDALQANAKKYPMSESAIRGRELFFGKRVNCAACHLGTNLTDEKYHNLGVGMDAEKPDLGRYEVTKVDKDKGAFKTPTIRNVAQSAPYMHDGSQKTLLEVVEHYNKGGIANKFLSDKVEKLKLTDQEKNDLVEFMKACTGELTPVNTKRLPE